MLPIFEQSSNHNHYNINNVHGDEIAARIHIMVGRWMLFLCVVLIARVAVAQETLSPDAARLARWIAARQYQAPALASYGAIRSAEGPAANGPDGRPYYDVSPYSANLAVIGLLQTRTPEAMTVADRWIHWYFAHLNARSAPEGVPYNHFYRATGDGETTCVKPGDPFLCHYNDATDSAAATFFLVLWAAHAAGMPASTLDKPDRRQEVERLANVVLKLQQPDGLCWAKSNYRVKYLEDNSEVFGGLSALARLDRDVFNDARRAHTYRDAAERVRVGILSELYDSKAKLFRVAKFENNDCPAPNLNTWYPDTQAQLWPVLFRVIDVSDPRESSAAAGIDGHWNGRIKSNWAEDPEHVNQGWVEAGHAYGALLMGETNRVRIYRRAVKQYKFKPEGGTLHCAGPFSVDDAGWLLRILSAPGITQ